LCHRVGIDELKSLSAVGGNRGVPVPGKKNEIVVHGNTGFVHVARSFVRARLRQGRIERDLDVRSSLLGGRDECAATETVHTSFFPLWNKRQEMAWMNPFRLCDFGGTLQMSHLDETRGWLPTGSLFAGFVARVPT
jgi:hypothetical protein